MLASQISWMYFQSGVAPCDEEPLPFVEENGTRTPRNSSQMVISEFRCSGKSETYKINWNLMLIPINLMDI